MLTAAEGNARGSVSSKMLVHHYQTWFQHDGHLLNAASLYYAGASIPIAGPFITFPDVSKRDP